MSTNISQITAVREGYIYLAYVTIRLISELEYKH